MFLQKIEKLANDWDCNSQDLYDVARESLLYGMRITRHPSNLKKELKKVKINSLIAKPLWSGNAYLLHTLPEVLTNKRAKIPCLADYLFARKTLNRSHLRELKARRKNVCKISREELLRGLATNIKRQTWHGRFIPQFDSMNESIKDVEQDLIVQALEVINKELSNFKTDNKEEIVNYLGYCIDQKSKTYLKQHTPKQIKARVNPEDLDRVVHESKKNEEVDFQFEEVEFRQDLKTMVSPRVYRGLALLMGFADIRDTQRFDRYLSEHGQKPELVSQARLKHYIEKFLGMPVFERVMETPDLRNFLLARINEQTEVAQDEGIENGYHGGYAKCQGF